MAFVTDVAAVKAGSTTVARMSKGVSTYKPAPRVRRDARRIEIRGSRSGAIPATNARKKCLKLPKQLPGGMWGLPGLSQSERPDHVPNGLPSLPLGMEEAMGQDFVKSCIAPLRNAQEGSFQSYFAGQKSCPKAASSEPSDISAERGIHAHARACTYSVRDPDRTAP